MALFDRDKQKLIQYCSCPKFNSQLVGQLADPDVIQQFNHQMFTNEDYEKICQHTDVSQVKDGEGDSDEVITEPEDIQAAETGQGDDGKMVEQKYVHGKQFYELHLQDFIIPTRQKKSNRFAFEKYVYNYAETRLDMISRNPDECPLLLKGGKRKQKIEAKQEQGMPAMVLKLEDTN